MFQTHHISSGAYMLYVETMGFKKDPACVLIPGAMQGTWGFSDRFCKRIRDKGFFVIRFDHRDIGRSTVTKPSEKEYSWIDLGQDIVAILENFNIARAHFVGHSMGGHLCQYLALAFPEKVLSISLIASGPFGATAKTLAGPNEDEKKLLKETWELLLKRKEGSTFEEKVEGFLKVYEYLNGAVSFDKEMGKAYVVAMLKNSPSETIQAGNFHERLMRRLGETLNERKGVLKNIKAPCLIIHGKLDPLALPSFAKSMGDEIPNSHFELIAKMGHMFLNRELEDTIADLILNHIKEQD